MSATTIACDDCAFPDGRHTFACQTNWITERDQIIETIVNLVDLAVEDFRAGNLTVDDLTAAIDQARELAAADDILFTEIVEEFDAATFNTIEAAGIIA